MVNHKGLVNVLRIIAVPALAVAGAAGLVVACSSSSSSNTTTPDYSQFTFDTAASIPGVDDTHCVGDAGTTIQNVVGSCEAGATTTDNSDGGTTESSQVHYNTVAFDDDCKYTVRWASTKIVEKQDVYFKITVTRTVDSSPATGAAPYAEVFLDDTHPAPAGTAKATSTEVGPGVYVIGPVQFDAPGNWTSRFHVYPTCNDAPASPHGHSAFYVLAP